MLINPRTIRAFNHAATQYGDDKFFAIKSDGHWFISNWVLGLDIPDDNIIDSPHFIGLQERADAIASASVEKQDILYHLSKRDWMHLLLGSGIYHDADLVQLDPEEQAVFEQCGWKILALETNDGKRFYVKEGYINLADSIIDGLQIAVFKPMINDAIPLGYNPLILFDKKGRPKGLCSIVPDLNLQDLVSSETMRHQDCPERNHVLGTP